MRACVYLEEGDSKVLIDCGPDFRTQAMRAGIVDVHDLLLTHTHADHVNGLDDLRSLNLVHKHAIDVFGERASLQDLRVRFAYCFQPAPPGGGIPRLDLVEITAGVSFQAGGFTVIPLRVFHGNTPILGFRIGKFAYLTDVSRLPEETFAALEGVDVLITSALRHAPHATHMSLDEAVDVAKRVGARKTWFTHMCHDLEHVATNAELPADVRLLYDGLAFEVSSHV
jgi:phosphoribosyl 1,2-cyclic phosphate phosphodiesterase